MNAIKQNQRFTVIIGNPPYSGASVNINPWIIRMVQEYYEIDGIALAERNLWLQDDYVKFVRAAQWMCDQSGSAVFGFITNHGYIDNPTFRGMRHSLLRTFPVSGCSDIHGN